MKTGKFIPDLANIFAEPVGSVTDTVRELQAAEVFTKGERGRYGGVDLTGRDVVNGILAVAIDHPRGVPPSESVRRARALRLEKKIELTPGFTRHLTCFEAKTAGEALDNLIFDFRNHHFALFGHGDAWKLVVSLDNKGEDIYITLSKDELGEHATQLFTSAAYASRSHLVDRRVIIDGAVFVHFAEALGYFDTYKVPNA